MNENALSLTLAQALGRDPTVVSAYLLGSFIRGEARADSDVDLAVVVRSKKSGTDDKIYELIRPIHFPKNLDLSVVDRSSSPLFLFQVVSKGKRIYEASTSDAASFEAFVLHRYFDTAHLRRLFESSLKDRFRSTGHAH